MLSLRPMQASCTATALRLTGVAHHEKAVLLSWGFGEPAVSPEQLSATPSGMMLMEQECPDQARFCPAWVPWSRQPLRQAAAWLACGVSS